LHRRAEGRPFHAENVPLILGKGKPFSASSATNKSLDHRNAKIPK
jgi:hypothetical protein